MSHDNDNDDDDDDNDNYNDKENYNDTCNDNDHNGSDQWSDSDGLSTVLGDSMASIIWDMPQIWMLKQLVSSILIAFAISQRNNSNRTIHHTKDTISNFNG